MKFNLGNKIVTVSLFLLSGLTACTTSGFPIGGVSNVTIANNFTGPQGPQGIPGVTQNIDGLVPYTGAVNNLNLGSYNGSFNGLTINSTVPFGFFDADAHIIASDAPLFQRALGNLQHFLGISVWVVSGTADDEIQDAINSGYNNIALSGGHFTLHNTVNTGSIWLHGMGPTSNGTIINSDANITTMLSVNATNYASFTDIVLTSNRSILSLDGFLISNSAWMTTIERVLISNINGQAIKTDKAFGVKVLNSNIRDCGTLTEAAIQITASSVSTTDVVLRDTLFEPNYYADIDIQNATDGLVVDNCWLEGANYTSREEGLQPSYAHIIISDNVAGVKNISITNSHFDHVTTWNGSNIRTLYVDGIRIDKNYFIRGGTTGLGSIDLGASTAEVAFTNNRVTSSTGTGIYWRGSNGGILNNYFDTITKEAIRVTGIKFFIDGNVITSADEGIHVGFSHNSIVTNNHLSGCTSYNIFEEGGADNVIYANNELIDKKYSFSGTYRIARGNIGYVTENSSSVILAANTSVVTVSHGLSATPTWVTISSSSNETGWFSWKGNTTSINITSSYNVTVNTTIYWRASFGQGN